MLTLRLRGYRGICAQYSSPSCRAHFTQANITGHGTSTALARSYATASSKTKDEVSSEGAQSEKPSRKQLSKAKPVKNGKLKRSKKKSDIESSQPTSAKKKGADASTASGAKDGASKKKSKATNEASVEGDEKADTIRVLREATHLLREFQANPAKFAAAKSSEAQSGKNKRSLKTQFTPIVGAPKYDERQTRIFYETLSVLGDALQVYAEGTSVKDKQTMADIAAAKDAVAQATTTDAHMHGTQANISEKSEKKSADTKQKQSSKKNVEPNPSPEPDTISQERPAQKAEPQHKLEPKDSTKEKDQSPQESEKKATDEAPRFIMAKKIKAKKGSPPMISDEASKKIAEAVANMQSFRKISRVAKKPNSKDEAELNWGDLGGSNQKKGIKVEAFRADEASALKPIEAGNKPVPLIQYGLDRVLFKDGVYPLQDPRTRVWNFDPYLATIMPVKDFDFDALKNYTTSSKDQKLINITKEQTKRYTGSTSSMTSTLAHFHYLLSQGRPINCERLSKKFEVNQEGFTAVTMSPAATIMNYKDGVYAIDADKEWDSETVLSMLGKSMEKLLTVPKDEFMKYHRSKSHELTEEEKGQEESYHYTTYGDFLMRSQLDAYDPRLPGTGVYDLKTRAVVTIRMDASNVHLGAGYEIRQRDGNWESFEREYFDMIRSAFLKYSLQVRMGRMDGIFVAFHNTERIFGFQYIPLEEMDLAIHGTSNTSLGDREFTASLKLLNELLDQATAKFPKQSLRVHVETRGTGDVPFMYFFAEPVSDERIKEIQEKRKGSIEKFKAKLGIPPSEKADTEMQSTSEEVDDVEEPVEAETEPIEVAKEVKVETEDSDQVWEDMMAVVEDTMDKDAEGITAIREAIQEALEQSGLLRAKSSEEAQHYVEALLKSIVVPSTELAKSESQNEEDEEVVEQSTNVESVEPESQPKQSTFGSLFSWFRPSATEANAPITETTQDDALPDPGSETKNVTKEADNGPSPELVELLVKLTTRVGISSTGKTATETATEQELSDDQARLRTFESILVDMMPKVLEPAEEDADAKTAPAKDTGDSPAATSTQPSKAETDPLFAMYVTVRNKVNDKPVARPEHLLKSDKWDIEYAMEELHGERAKKLYRSCMGRRKATQDPSKKRGKFKTLWDGALPKYTKQGRTFRQEEERIASKQPVWIVGQPAPLSREQVFKGAGAGLVHVLPSLEHGRPSDYLPAGADQGCAKKELADDKKAGFEDSVAGAVAELRKTAKQNASSFKEWREKSKQHEK